MSLNLGFFFPRKKIYTGIHKNMESLITYEHIYGKWHFGDFKTTSAYQIKK